MNCELPADALLARYGPPHYTDCFTAVVAGDVSLGEYVYAFYTAPLFRCERMILRLIGRGSSDADADRLVKGAQDSFAAWSVEDRTDNQLLMCDFQSRTRSWFQVAPATAGTRLHFGSAVTTDADKDAPPPRFRILLGLHRVYSKLLLRGAIRRLARSAS